MPNYDAARFDPPAPVGSVSLRNPKTGAVCPDVPMLLDSGADVTMIPRAVLDQLAVAPIEGRQYELAAFDGGTSYADVVRLDLVFSRRIFRGQFLVVDKDCGILGRNVLNSLSLRFDGPALTWEEGSSIPRASKDA